MKKSNLLWGICYTLGGGICLFAALTMESRLDALLFGAAGAGLVPGILLIVRYFYWNAPGSRERYQERMEQEKIEQQDELKEKLRDKSGRYAYVLGLLVICIAMLVFSVLEVLGMLEGAQMIVLFLGAYLVFQIVAGIVIFNHLLQKY